MITYKALRLTLWAFKHDQCRVMATDQNTIIVTSWGTHRIGNIVREVELTETCNATLHDVRNVLGY